MSNTKENVRKFWIFGYDARVMTRFDWYLARNHKLGVQNLDKRSTAFLELKAAMGHPYPEDIVLPDDFPPVQLALPEKGFSPDYFGYGSDNFCSRRLRDAMNLPDGMVQFMPIELVSGGAQVLAQDYQLMRVVAHQPVLDMERSVYEPIDDRRAQGNHPPRPMWFERFVLLETLQSVAEIFRADEIYVKVFVTDALAERVLQAGCTGMEFYDPTLPQHGDRLRRYRTATGIGERWI